MINHSNILENDERSFIYVSIREWKSFYAMCMISVRLKNFARLNIIYLIIDIVINLRIIENLTGKRERKQNSTISNTPMFYIVMKKDGCYLSTVRKSRSFINFYAIQRMDRLYSCELRRFFMLVNISDRITVWFTISLQLLTSFFCDWIKEFSLTS